MIVRRRLSNGLPWYVECPECGRIFDLADPDDAAEATHGHDCEA